ncbi:MAG: hypothetical protein IPL67_08895 [Ignavibacteria bacterium]|nr:hypothetical protein [Ignavibacteria bacterium]
MQKSNLIKILLKLNSSEFKSFGKFVNSPYFNTNKKLSEFYEELKKYYPAFDDLNLTKENIFRKLYGQDKVVMGTMYFLISEMEALLEKFLSIERIDPVALELSMLKTIGSMNLNKLFDVKYRNVKKQLTKAPDNYNLNNFMLANINRANMIERKESLTKKDVFKKEWLEPVNELVKLFLKNMLWNISLFSNFKKHLNEKLDIPFYNEVLSYVETNKLHEKDLGMKLLLYQTKMINDNDEKYYFELKRIFEDSHRFISLDDTQELMANLNNFCMKKVISGFPFQEEQFEIQNLFLKHYIEKTEDSFPIDAFNQIFMLGMSLGKVKWAKDYVRRYGKRLEEKFRDNALPYSNAVIYFREKQFGQALKQLSSIKNFSHIFYKPSVKLLQLKTYYELGLYAEAADVSNSFIQFLRNDRLTTSDIKKVYSDFIGIYKKLLSAQFSADRNKINSLKHEIETKRKFLIARNWFKEKINELL